MSKGINKKSSLKSKAIKANAKDLSVYIDLLTDFGFKRVFGIKEVMLKFLNAVLNIEGGIADLSYVDTEVLGLTKEDRKAVYDLICVTGNGEHIIVEMQSIRQEYFKDRTRLYLAMLIHQQAMKGRAKDRKNWDFKQPPVYIISFANFYMDKEEEEAAKEKAKAKKNSVTDENETHIDENYISFIKYMNVDTKKIFIENETLVYIELPKFSKKLDEVKTFIEQWIYLVKNIHRLKKLPKSFTDEIFETVFEIAKIAQMDKKDVYKYVKSLNDKNMVRNEINRMKNTIAQQKGTIAQQKGTITQQSSTITQQSNTIAVKDKEIAEYRRMLGLN